MLPVMNSSSCKVLRTPAAPCRSVHLCRAPPADARRLPAAQSRFPSIKRFSSDTGAEGDDQLVGEQGQILQGKQHLQEGNQPGSDAMDASNPMSEDKKGSLPEQGGAPEGDRAAAGQAYQPTGETGSAVASPESGEKRVSSGEQAPSQLASEESKQQEDRTPLQD